MYILGTHNLEWGVSVTVTRQSSVNRSRLGWLASSAKKGQPCHKCFMSRFLQVKQYKPGKESGQLFGSGNGLVAFPEARPAAPRAELLRSSISMRSMFYIPGYYRLGALVLTASLGKTRRVGANTMCVFHKQRYSAATLIGQNRKNEPESKLNGEDPQYPFYENKT